MYIKTDPSSRVELFRFFYRLRRHILAVGMLICALSAQAQSLADSNAGRAAGDVIVVASGSSTGGSWVGNTWVADIAGSTVSASEIMSHLAVGATAISTSVSADVIINGAISWSANTPLTLTSARDIKVNANISATGNTAGLVLGYGTGRGYTLANGVSITLPGTTPTLKIGVAGSEVTYTVINSLGVAGDTSGTTLQGINGHLAGHYALGSNIDATATSGWHSGAGFTPLGWVFGTLFSGSMDGLGHTITNLVINASGITSVGLFGSIGSLAGDTVVRNIGLVGGSVRGDSSVGALVGDNRGSVVNSYATSDVTGDMTTGDVGGLVGSNYGTINGCHASGNVSGSNYVGGLAGSNGGVASAAIYNSYANGNVTVIGSGTGGGGLVGQNDFTLSNSYATGNVSGSYWYLGGLVGINWGTISNTYATGTVSGGGSGVGGLIGSIAATDTLVATVNNSYASGSVGGVDYVGGLVGYIDGTSAAAVNNGFWDAQTSGQDEGIASGPTASATAVGLSTAETMTQASFTGFDFTNTWWMKEGSTRPLLRSTPGSFALTASKTGNGSGSVTSNPAGVACGATCTTNFNSAVGSVTLTATPNSGSSFTGWSGACSGTGTCTVTMNAAQTVTANFILGPLYGLTVNKSGSGLGVVMSNLAGIDCGGGCTANYPAGTTVTLTASPWGSSQFLGWSGACTGTTSTCQVTLSAARSVTARFHATSANTIGNALGNSGLFWTSGGDAPWVVDSSIVQSGTGAMRSGSIVDNQSSTLTTTVRGPGTLSFYWRVSSEADYDKLYFFVDGVKQMGAISGEVAWVQVTRSIPAGLHELTWQYHKDGATSSGSDAGWVDSVVMQPFADVSGSSWAASYITGIYNAGITTGCGSGNYCPAGNVPRDQMAAFLVRAKEGDPAAGYCGTTPPFADVPVANTFCGHIKRLKELNITTGCGGGNYCINDNVTRQQMATFIVRAVEGEPALNYCASGSGFADVPTSNSMCRYIKRLAELNVTTGCGGGNYCPDSIVTRDQMAAFLARAFLGM